MSGERYCIENCSSCTDERCVFHERNYDEEKIKALLEEKEITYKKRISTRSSRFQNRKITIITVTNGMLEEKHIPIPDTDILCGGCNENIYSKPFGWFIYLSESKVVEDRPYDVYCDECIAKYFPDAEDLSKES